MLVKIFAEDAEGGERDLNFETVPKVGDQVALDGTLYRVTGAWHRPGERWSEAGIAIKLGRDSEPNSLRALGEARR